MSPRRRAHPLRPALPLLAALSFCTVGACQPKPSPASAEPVDEPDPLRDELVQHVPDRPEESLVFPPPWSDRRSRPALVIEDDKVKAVEESADEAFAVRYPNVEGSGKFHFSGQSFTVSFNKPVKLPRKLRKKPVPADAGTVTIEPEVKGKARWVSARVLEFTADKPYDPDLFYKVTIAGLTSDPQVEGEEPEALAPWTAEFSAEPRIYLAGKVLTYLPRKGEEKVIAVYPPEGAKVGVDVELGVIFDQPIGLAKAGKLITLTKSDNKPVKFTLSHAASTSYQGSKVNKRQVVIVTPEAPFSPGDELELRATDGTRELLSDPEVTVHDFHIAAPLELSDVRCGYGYNNTCEYKAPKLLMSGRDVAVEFNNAIATTGGALKAAVTVSPPVLNMSVWSSGTWEGTGIVRISGDFKSSTRYNVRIAGLRDRYGDELDEPVSLQVTTMPQTASASMPEGALVLDETASKAFKVTTRNVVRAALEVWPVDADDPRALEKAKRHASRHTKPEEDAPIKIPFMPQVARDEFVTTELDLLGKLTSGTSYLIALSIEGTAFGAKETEYPSWSRAQSDPVALITPGDARALAIHTHATGDATVVHVARLGDGTPVPGASFKLNGEAITGAPTTDSNGVAVLPIKQNSLSGGVLSVAASGANAALSAGPGGVSGDSLFPSMASADAAAELLDSDERVVLMTDRGIYRPGATVHIKAMYRRKVGERYTPITNTPVQVTVTGPQDDEIETLQGVTNDMGGVAFDFESPAGGKVGRHELVFSSVEDEAPLARAFVQIAEFEPPRFTVDVDAREAGKAKLQATVAGRYLFGAPMDGSEVEWTLTRSAASLPAGKLSDAGLAFDDGRDDYYYWDDDRSEERWSRSGRGTLAADGTLVLNQKVELGDAGPVRFELEADVADASYRHIAGRGSVVLHPAQRYAGVKVASSWGPVGKPMSVGLGVADREGAPVEGATVTAKLVRVTWKYTRRSDASGTHYDWHATRTQVDSCSVTSARTVVACELTPPRSGEYDVISSVDGRDGGARSIWSWGDGSDRALFPTKGRKLDIVTDKGSYKPGDTAKLLVRNPYPAATAILTLEQGKLLTHRAIAMTGAAEIIEVPILRAHTPHVHATITVLPRGATGDDRVDWKIGAVRLPVSMDAERLKLEVKTDRDAYEPGQEVTIDLTLRDGTKPAPGSEIAVAVVDEGILRMTNHHAPDPVKALRPGQPLDFRVEDTREGLAAFLRLSQTAGDGDASEGNASQARKNFVETALWRPDVRTNARGEAQIKFTLPDNLTRFRVMAVALDGDGKGASSEHGFYVRKPVMAMPVVPRFAHVGDAFEAAVMVHNNLSEPMTAHVTLGDETRDVVLAGESRSRVGFPMQPPRPGPLALEFTVRDDAEVRDRVLVTVPVARPGVLEHPRLDGAFVKRQAIELKVPAKVVSGRGGKETVRVLVGQHLWPELGARLEY
ncbi:MAG: MG2 domain-containing protein, partial [Nannocystaceae bacterium]